MNEQVIVQRDPHEPLKTDKREKLGTARGAYCSTCIRRSYFGRLALIRISGIIHNTFLAGFCDRRIC